MSTGWWLLAAVALGLLALATWALWRIARLLERYETFFDGEEDADQ